MLSTAMDASTPVKSATFDSMIVLATRLAYLSCFSCSTGSPLFTTGPPKETQSRKSLNASTFVVFGANGAPDLDAGHGAQQEQRALDAPEFTESSVEQVTPAVGAELARGNELASWYA